MYTGPGSGPMVAAAAAWSTVAAELHSAAVAYESAITRLVAASWLGPSAVSMVAAATPYVAWLQGAAGQAEQTATQAQAAAAAYGTAFATTVPPPVVAANRAQLAVLVATNVLGQNTAAIAATEAHYGEMWAQDAAAMYGYAAASAGATALDPFRTPPQMTTAGAGNSAAGQSGAAASGVAQAISGVAQESVIPPLLGDLITIEGALLPAVTITGLVVGASSWNAAAINSRLLIRNTDEILGNHETLLHGEDQLRRGQEEIKSLIAGGSRGLTSALSGPTATPAPLSAGLARAVSVGKLSVPLNWAAAAPEIRTVGYALPAANPAAAPPALAGSAGTAFSEMGLAGMSGSALAGGVSRNQPPPGRTAPARPTRPAVPVPDDPLVKVTVGIRELGKLHESGLLTDAEFAEQKHTLLRHLERSLAGALPPEDGPAPAR